VGPAGAVVADGQEAGSSADVDAAAADRRHTVADQGRCAVARRARSGTSRGTGAYDLFRRWQRDGTWKQIFVQLQAEADAKGLITWEVSVDSTLARAHQHAAG
jgi:transposase